MIRIHCGDFSADELLYFAVHVGYKILGIFEMDLITGEVFPLLQSHISGAFCQIFNKFQHEIPLRVCEIDIYAL